MFGLKATSKRGEANDLCKPECPESKRSEIDSLDNSASSANAVAIVGFVAGGVGLAAGATLFFLSQPKKEAAPSAFVHPWIGLGSAGLAGKF